MTAVLARTAHAIRSRALNWLHTQHTQHTMGALESGVIGDGEAYKALHETALAASLILRDGTAGGTERALARELLDFSWRQMREGALLHERMLRHPLATDALEGYGHFARAGYRNADMERLIPHIAAMGTVRSAEHPPSRRLAVANALRLTGHGHSVDAATWRTLTRATWLGGTPQPWHLDWATAYAVTHTVFHLTDWGAHPEWLPDDLAAYLDRWLPVWTDVWAESRQWDLVGELLIVDSCLPAPHGDITDWRLLAQVQHADGLVPRDGEPVDDDPATRFRDHQHPTVVAAVAGTVALTRALDSAALRPADGRP
ncbi:DUF6895 family protein [Streptomyces sp. URMC 126]|uniref:DUF6895 family protein n=1 Tax=Streptomyces sp. URMC 126 TaxID=3423401 RepID=UPI003F1D140F